MAQDHALKQEALQHGRGQIDLQELKAAALREEHTGIVLMAGREVATVESLARERAMIAAIQEGQGQYRRLGGAEEWIVSDRLRLEQKRAVQVVLDSRDLAVNLRGAAGTGKTATLQEIHRGLTAGGREIVAVAPTRSAVEELEKVGFREALTLERLLQDPRAQTRLRGQVVIVDEAGMVSSRQMSQLLQLAGQQHAQIVFSGDTRQIQSVEAGDALRVLERESRLRSVSLSQVQRQTLAEYRGAVEELRQNPARGFAHLEGMGAVREVDWALRPQKVSKVYREALGQANAQGQARSVLVVAPTHAEIRRLTEAIRTERQRVGELGESQPVTRHIPLHWTEAQKRDTRKYKAGLVLEFHKATRQVGKHEAVEVVSVEQDKLLARKDNGVEVTLTRRQAQAFSVYERQELAVAPGDKLLLEANRRESGFRATNGELVTVRGVQEGRLELEDGRVLPGNYRQFDHGYAVTAHRSQGKTVDAVIVAGDRMSRELFYVAATRGRESVTIVTSDKEQLQAAIGLSGERSSATELARKATGEKQLQRLPEFTLGQHLHSAGTWALRQARELRRDERLRPLELSIDQAPQALEPPKRNEKQQEKSIEHGYGFGF